MADAEYLQRLLRPRSVAVIGGEDAEMAASQLRDFGYDGAVWAVSPRRDALAGFPCCRSVAELPGVPDAVFIGVPRAATLEIVQELRAMGAGGAVCFAAGYREKGPQGRAEEDALVAAAGGMALLGPNCYGHVNCVEGVAVWPYFHGCRRVESGVALISQSGMIATSLTMNERAPPFSHVVSTGNQAMLGAEDFISVLAPDRRVTGFALYVEGVRDADRFRTAAARAIAGGKPVVALAAGRSRAGGRIVANHTGSHRRNWPGLMRLFDEIGVIRVETPNQLLETLKLAVWSPAPRGTRVAAFTCSGGDAAVLADCGEAHGLSFPQPSRSVRGRLRRLMPDIAAVSNPLDFTTKLWGKPEIEQVFRVMLEDDYDAAVFVQDFPRADLPFDSAVDIREAAQFAAAARGRGIPAIICSSIFENIDCPTREQLRGVGAVPIQGFAEAMRAISQTAARTPR